MIWIVVTIHILLSLGLLWAAWQAWLLKSVLAGLVEKIDGWSKACQQGLTVSAPAILIAQRGTNSVQEKYKALTPQLQRIRTILAILSRMRFILGSLMYPKLKKSPKSQAYTSTRSERYGKRRR